MSIKVRCLKYSYSDRSTGGIFREDLSLLHIHHISGVITRPAGPRHTLYQQSPVAWWPAYEDVLCDVFRCLSVCLVPRGARLLGHWLLCWCTVISPWCGLQGGFLLASANKSRETRLVHGALLCDSFIIQRRRSGAPGRCDRYRGRVCVCAHARVFEWDHTYTHTYHN